MTRRTAGQVARFGVVGLVNTAFTGAIFIGLSLAWVPQAIAYSVAYLVGITFVLLVIPIAVFGTRPSATRRLVFGAWYLAMYALGLGFVILLGTLLRLDRVLVAVLTVACTALLSFLAARVLFDTTLATEGDR